MKAKSLLHAIVFLAVLFWQGLAISPALAQSSRVTVDHTQGRATIAVSAQPNQTIQLRYQGELGKVLAEGKTDDKGTYTFEVELLRGYAQHLVVQASDTDSLLSVAVPVIPAKGEGLGLSNERVKELLTAHRWKSVAEQSRVLVRQTVEQPHYHKLSTFAQKHFTFHADGTFDLAVTVPKEFAYPGGSWSLDEEGRLTIHTTIPRGPLEYNNSHIQKLTADTLELLVYVQDGVFLIGFTKE